MLCKTLLLAAAAALPLAACYTEAPAPAYAVTATAAPTAIGPGVELVSDPGGAAFFADDFYWYLDGGVWYRAAYLGGPRVRVDVVPPVIARIRRPEIYVHTAPRAAFVGPGLRRPGGVRRL